MEKRRFSCVCVHHWVGLNTWPLRWHCCCCCCCYHFLFCFPATGYCSGFSLSMQWALLGTNPGQMRHRKRGDSTKIVEIRHRQEKVSKQSLVFHAKPKAWVYAKTVSLTGRGWGVLAPYRPPQPKPPAPLIPNVRSWNTEPLLVVNILDVRFCSKST